MHASAALVLAWCIVGYNSFAEAIYYRISVTQQSCFQLCAVSMLTRTSAMLHGCRHEFGALANKHDTVTKLVALA